MHDPKAIAKALRDECEKLARQQERRMSSPDLSEAERIAAMEAAKVYWQLRSNHADNVYHAEIARPEKHTGKNKGTQQKTIERTAFIRMVAEQYGIRKREAIASQALEDHASRVRTLWRAEGESARRKLLYFMNNNRIP